VLALIPVLALKVRVHRGNNCVFSSVLLLGRGAVQLLLLVVLVVKV
jgi:hypothetical protein